MRDQESQPRDPCAFGIQQVPSQVLRSSKPTYSHLSDHLRRHDWISREKLLGITITELGTIAHDQLPKNPIELG